MCLRKSKRRFRICAYSWLVAILSGYGGAVRGIGVMSGVS